MVANPPWVGLVGALLVACSSATDAASPPLTLAAVLGSASARVGAQRGDPSRCVVEGRDDSLMAGDYVVLDDKGVQLATARADRLKVRVTARQGEPRASIELLGGVHVRGFVDLSRMRFETRTRIDLVRDHVFVDAGSTLGNVTVGPGSVRADVASPMAGPSSLTLSCEDLAFDAKGATEVVEGHGWFSPRSPGDDLRFFDAPRGRLILRAKPTEPLERLEADGTFVRVLLGRARPRCQQGIVIDAWVRAEDLKPSKPPPDVDDACGWVRDENDRCPGVEMKGASDLWLRADKGAATERLVGTVDAGTDITVHRVDGARAQITFDDDSVRAPPGSSFFVESSKVDTKCIGDDADGCPDC